MPPVPANVVAGVLEEWLQATSEVIRVVGIATALYASANYFTQPYHTSKLSGQEWVEELMHGHPDRIHCELGVHLPVFINLIITLRGMGYGDKQYVRLEEQLAIFLYGIVTGLSVRHIGERFQRSNETVAK